MYLGTSGGQQLRYIFEVMDTDIKVPTIDDSDCVLSKRGLDTKGPWLKLKFIREIPAGAITLEDLKEHGLPKHPQNPLHITWELQKYIDSVLQ